jgi:hypothetical protein
MDRDDEYRAKAEEARRQADFARADVDRDAWLRLAQAWFGMIRKRPQSDDDTVSK